MTKSWFWCMHCEQLFRAPREAFGTIEVDGTNTIHRMRDPPLECPGVAEGDCDGNYLDVFPATDYPNMPRPHWPPPETWHEGDRLPLYEE